MKLSKLTQAVMIALPLAFALSCATPDALAARGNPNAKVGQPSQPVYDVVVDYDVKIKLRDGTTVVADVHRPKTPGKYPTLMEGTPYGKNGSSEMSKGTHAYFVPRGYVVVSWESRGCKGSEGERNLHVQEQNDCYDVVEWIAKQPWSNGKVAPIGVSYMGQVQFNTVIAQPPHLTCALPGLTANDLWREWYFRGGAMEYAFAASWASLTFGGDLAKRNLTKEQAQAWDETKALVEADKESFFSVIPAADLELAQIGDKHNLLKEWASHYKDGPYWWLRDPKTYYQEMNVPMMHIGGWYDVFQPGSYHAYNNVRQLAPSSLARDNQSLVIGPWTHLAPLSTKQGEVEYAPGLKKDFYHTARLEFFDYWMKDIQHAGYDAQKPVRIFVMGENKWRSENEWPLARTKYTKYYLNPLKSGTIESLNDGRLVTYAPKKMNKPLTYKYDPMKPTPTRGGATLYSFPYGPDGAPGAGPLDQSPIDKTMLTFTTEKLTKATEVTGPVKAVLYASSSAVDTDWVVRVTDVSPDGKSITVVDGIQRARFRTSGTRPSLLEPGKIYEFEVDLWATSYVFKPGHRIRVTVNSSSFPRWSRNMNVAEVAEFAKEHVVADNTIYIDAKHPSHVILPIIPRK